MELVNNKKEEEEKQFTHWSPATFPGKTVHSNEINIEQSSITMTICTVKSHLNWQTSMFPVSHNITAYYKTLSTVVDP